MPLFKKKKRTDIFNFLGFLKTDISKFLKAGQGISATNLNLPTDTPVQKIITTRVKTRETSSIGVTSSTDKTFNLFGEDAVANISQAQLDAFINAFTIRVGTIRRRLARPGRERTFIRG